MIRSVRTRRRSTAGRPAPAAPLFLAAALIALSAPLTAGPRFGDAVPAMVRPADLAILKDRLNLNRFSVIAAVGLGSLDGRELVIAEPLSEEVIAQIEESCEADRFCVNPAGFVASRVRIVHLRDRDVAMILTVEGEARDRQGRIFALSSFDMPGRLVGWNGYADAASGHLVLVLTPIVQIDDDPVEAADPVPFTLMWDEEEERFALYECSIGDGDVETCEFYRDEPD